jgi:hypothetical protein
MFRRIFATLLVFTLPLGRLPVRAAGVTPLGVVTQASGAALDRASISVGATVYDGDSFSTASGGLLRVRVGAAQFYLPGQSAIKLHAAPGGATASLTSGGIVFSSARAVAMDIDFSQAHIRPVGDQPTVAQISALSPRELEVRAQQGALQFSYEGETNVIPEGTSCRILLDPTDEEASGGASAFPDQGGPKHGRKRRRAFIIFWSGVGGIILPFLTLKAVESPDKP